MIPSVDPSLAQFLCFSFDTYTSVIKICLSEYVVRGLRRKKVKQESLTLGAMIWDEETFVDR
jgi:hypothetical protein